MLKYDEYTEVVEDTHNPEGKGKDNLYQRLGKHLYCLIEGAMDAEMLNRVKVELNITKAE